jgi:hypothetical protein
MWIRSAGTPRATMSDFIVSANVTMASAASIVRTSVASRRR